MFLYMVCPKPRALELISSRSTAVTLSESQFRAPDLSLRPRSCGLALAARSLEVNTSRAGLAKPWLPRMALSAAPGPAWVTRCASDHSGEFVGYAREHLDRVMELPKGTYVLVLEPEGADEGWANVIFEDNGGAFRTWIHPESVRAERRGGAT